MSRVRIAHLSDPHFGTIHENVMSSLTASLREHQPDLVLVSGDITQRARRKQFQAARAFRESLGSTRFFAVPGNHDIPLFNLFGRFFNPYAGFHRYFQHQRETDLRLAKVRVVGLNSTSRWRHVQGSLHLKRIRETFLSHWDDSDIRVAMVHHPLDCAKSVDDKNRLKGREETLKLFEESKIDLVLSGHVHDPYIEVDQSIILCVAGTCLSWRTREGAPNSYNLIDVESDPKQILITRMDLSENGLFAPKAGWVKNFRYENGWVQS